MLGIYLKVLLSLLPVLVVFGQVFESLLCAKHCRLRMNFLSWPWRTRCHYNVFWSFDPSFLLNQWSCVACSLCVISVHLGIRETMGWIGPGVLRSWAQCCPWASWILASGCLNGMQIGGPCEWWSVSCFEKGLEKITPNCRTYPS